MRADERYLRPADVDELVADATRAHDVLGWKPRVEFDHLIRMMVEFDLWIETDKASRTRTS